MSKHIGLVVEGKTDRIILEQALLRLMDGHPAPVVSQLQPAYQPDFHSQSRGEGWGGVYRWCVEVASEPETLALYDLIIVHLDADVAEKRYSDINVSLSEENLPCKKVCPPARDTVLALESVVHGWLGGVLPAKLILCIPSRVTEAWLIPALFSNNQDKLQDLECRHVYSWLANKNVKLTTQAGRKNPKAYKESAMKMAEMWEQVTAYCEQAKVFELRVATLIK